MPSLVTAQDGDFLCTIAIDSGFLNCQPPRDEGANAALLNRDLVTGDIVTVPDVDLGGDGGSTDLRQVFVRRTAPPVSTRMVHGSPNIPYLQDETSPLLHISNHQTTRGGPDDASVLPGGFGFNQLGHDDPDTFKIEVVDPQASSPVNIKLEALRRVLLPTGAFGHDVFSAGERGRRPDRTIAQADRRIARWVRRTYAQAGMSPRPAQATEIVDPQNNLVAIGEPHGLTARGGGQMGFRLTSTGNPTQVIGPIPTVAKASPEAMANVLQKLVGAPYVATVSRNPAGFNDPVGNRGADIVITVPGGVVIIDQEVSTDTRQTLTIGQTNTAALAGFSNDFLIGSSEQRALLKTYDTGVLEDLVHATGARAEHQLMMGTGTDLLASAPASKRIKERPQLYDSPGGSHRQIDRIHDKAKALLGGF